MSNTIVYLPGIAGDAGVSPALQQLVDEGGASSIPPVPGFDGATGFTPPHDYLDWLVVFWDAIDATGATADGPVDVVGASVGGMIAAELAVMRPEVVARLALLAPFGIADENNIGFDLYADTVQRAARPPVRQGRARAGRRPLRPLRRGGGAGRRVPRRHRRRQPDLADRRPRAAASGCTASRARSWCCGAARTSCSRPALAERGAGRR